MVEDEEEEFTWRAKTAETLQSLLEMKKPLTEHLEVYLKRLVKSVRRSPFGYLYSKDEKADEELLKIFINFGELATLFWTQRSDLRVVDAYSLQKRQDTRFNPKQMKLDHVHKLPESQISAVEGRNVLLIVQPGIVCSG